MDWVLPAEDGRDDARNGGRGRKEVDVLTDFVKKVNEREGSIHCKWSLREVKRQQQQQQLNAKEDALQCSDQDERIAADRADDDNGVVE
ncbi:unnamed protein product [Sympodiomycopsis kandeliae]